VAGRSRGLLHWPGDRTAATSSRIWRRLSLPGDLVLDAVHLQFQAAMGWTESHLHRFQPGTGQAH
jgi:hypothetical protein